MADPNTFSPARNRSRPLLFLALFMLAVAGAMGFPPSFRFLATLTLRLEAARHGLHLNIPKIEGSIFEPLQLDGVSLSGQSEPGSTLRLDANRVRLTFAWKNLLFNRSATFWQELRIEGLTGGIDLPTAATGKMTGKASGQAPRLILPSVLDLQDATLAVRQGGDLVRFDHIAFRASDLEAGELRIGALAIKQPWLTTHFANLHGTIALQNSRLALADLKLGDTLVIQNASADLPELLRERLKMDFALAAFGGAIRGELRSAPRDQHLNFESIGTFSRISIAQLADFFNEDADGAIKEGKFTFRGSPRDLPKATFSARFEATDFRWGKRQWNSLVLGATLINRRLMIPELQLKQAHNSLTLKGEMAIPSDTWWQDDFDFTIAAKIGNLTELSALLGAEFANTAGQLTIDGAVRGQKQAFNGQLTVSGAHLSYRTAPLDKLEATLKIAGNELQITNAELAHGSDFLRGHGVVNILGEKRYWGEVKASVADLALYSAFLQPPITPEALAGGLVLDWSGDGTAMAHSGAFTAQLRKIRPLVAAEAHPLDVDAEGTYSPANIFFSKFVLSDSETKLSARLIADPQSITLQALRLTHEKETWLQGEAELPLNVWAVWQNPDSASWWNFESPCKIHLVAQKLGLRETQLLSGKERSLRGEIDGSLATDGTLAKLTMNGAAQLRKVSGTLASFPIKTAEADFLFHDQTVEVKNLRATANDLDLTADGVVQLGDVRTPQLALALHFHSLPLAFNPALHLDTAADLQLTGPPETARVTGNMRISSATLDRRLDLAALIAPSGLGLAQLLEPIALVQIPFSKWQFDLDLNGSAPLQLANSSGVILSRLHLSGSPAEPKFSGQINVANLTVSEGATQLTVDSGSLFFSESHEWPPSLFVQLQGRRSGIHFTGLIFGSTAEKRFQWNSDHGWSEEEIRILFDPGAVAPDLDAPFFEKAISLDLLPPAVFAPPASILNQAASNISTVWPEPSPRP